MAPPKPVETEEHELPSIDSSTRADPALVVAFPEPAALPLPPSGQPVGRDWLFEHGITDTKVSGSHFQVSKPGGVVHIEDVGSRNGTFVAGRRLATGERVALTDGAFFRAGRTVLVYRAELAGRHEPSPPVGDLVGPYGLRPFMQGLESLCVRPPLNVLLEGETGTGKELAAGAVAERLRPGRPYAPVNVAGLASGVFESQLFGYVAGAFSGSGRGAPGVFAKHQGGTVFLDEIGELPLEAQPKLLRLLENREVLPVGGDTAVRVDVLVVAATNRALDDMVDAGAFRRDLHARLAAARLELPPLRERPEDLFAVAQALLARRNEAYDPAEVEVEAIERLLLHGWPSNVRELSSVLDRVAALEPPPRLRLHAVEKVLGPGAEHRPSPLTRERVDAALAKAAGNQSRAARELGVSRGQLLRFLKRG